VSCVAHAVGPMLSARVQRFPWYGGTGIGVCDRWRSDFAGLLADVGRKPAPLMLRRADTNGDHEPENCEWSEATDGCLDQPRRGAGMAGECTSFARPLRGVSVISECEHQR
jgi:hypothetical protein